MIGKQGLTPNVDYTVSVALPSDYCPPHYNYYIITDGAAGTALAYVNSSGVIRIRTTNANGNAYGTFVYPLERVEL